MPVAFGFSVGDFITAIELTSTIVDALREAGGSSTRFRSLIAEFEELRFILLQIQNLNLDARLSAQQLVIEAAATRCLLAIQAFWEKAEKYEQHLLPCDDKPNLKRAWARIKWAICKKEVVEEFREQIHQHKSTLALLLLRTQMQLSTMNAKNQQNNHIALTTQIQSFAGIMITKLNAIAEGVAKYAQQGVVLLSTTTQIFSIASETLRIVQAIHTLLQIPAQVQLRQPVVFTDPFERTWAFHLDYISSAEEFLAVLKIKFENASYDARILDYRDYVIRDERTHKVIDICNSWDRGFFPGQRAAMSVVFWTLGKIYPTCPACHKRHERYTDKDITCSCGTTFQRVVELEEATRSLSGESPKQESRHSTNVPSGIRMLEPDEWINLAGTTSEVFKFRRVRIVGVMVPLPAFNLGAAPDNGWRCCLCGFDNLGKDERCPNHHCGHLKDAFCRNGHVVPTFL